MMLCCPTPARIQVWQSHAFWDLASRHILSQATCCRAWSWGPGPKWRPGEETGKMTAWYHRNRRFGHHGKDL